MMMIINAETDLALGSRLAISFSVKFKFTVRQLQL